MSCDRCPNAAGLAIIIVGAIFVGFLLWMSGWAHGRNELMLQAVREGHAQWVTEKETGKAYIEWIKK